LIYPQVPQAHPSKGPIDISASEGLDRVLGQDSVALDDLDREEILRTRELAIQQNRVSAGTSLDPGEVLDRLKLRQDGG